MRHFGAILLIVGIAGYFYCSSELAKAPPLPPEKQELSESLSEPAGRWDLARYVALLAGGIGAVLLLMPRQR